MDEKNSQFILLKIPPNLVRLLGKIHALSIEVLCLYNIAVVLYVPERTELKFLCPINFSKELIDLRKVICLKTFASLSFRNSHWYAG